MTGLLRSHKKNVPISKKDVIYVMDSLYEAGSFASQMEWNSQTNVSILKLKLDTRYISQDMNTGAFESWKEYHRDISVSRIMKVIPFNDAFKKAHKARMDKIFKRGKEIIMYIK